MGEAEFGVRVFLAAVLMTAAVGKARAFDASVLPLLPARLARPATALLICGEALLAVLLIVPSAARLGAAGAGVLFGAFTVGVAWLVHRGVGAQCRCFGGVGTPLARHHVVRNLLLTGLAALAAVLGPQPSPAVPGLLTAAAAGLVLALLLSRWDDLAALLSSDS